MFPEGHKGLHLLGITALVYDNKRSGTNNKGNESFLCEPDVVVHKTLYPGQVYFWGVLVRGSEHRIMVVMLSIRGEVVGAQIRTETT